jgi:N6-L-threonylcarbamoyladenine synthase
MRKMRILAIETSCDETALALLEAEGTLAQLQFKPLKSIISSQIALHREWGGVVPNIAKREHIKNLPLIFNKILKDREGKIDAIAVTVGPGLEPALWAGITFAKELFLELKEKNKKIELIGVNHLEGHLYSSLLLGEKITFPAIALIVSGGHTILLEMKSLTKKEKLGETKDDAVGEAFDKVARMLNLPYPGGPEIQKIAKKGNSRAIEFPRPMLYAKNFDFSFSGLKTSVLYHLRDNPNAKKEDVAASFQYAAIDVLVKKTIRAAEESNAKSVILSGGVAANKMLRETLAKECKERKLRFFAPPMDFNTDNAMMIAVAGYINWLQKKSFPLEANGNLSI